MRKTNTAAQKINMNPKSFDDIKDRAWLYATARITQTGQCVRLLGVLFAPLRFIVAPETTAAGLPFEVPWEQLDSFAL